MSQHSVLMINKYKKSLTILEISDRTDSTSFLIYKQVKDSHTVYKLSLKNTITMINLTVIKK
jgi:hypothetical protein